MSILQLIAKKLPYSVLDEAFCPKDRQYIRRTRNISLIPSEKFRRGGKYSYAEWAHVIGIFQTLIYLHLQQDEGNSILDIGCGTGLLGISSQPFIGEGSQYVGIDVSAADIDFCRRHYPPANFDFIHFDRANAAFAPNQNRYRTKWPVASDSFDLALALSVWTHLNEDDALYYFQEISRVLKPTGKAIITFFLLDETYKKTLDSRSNKEGRFHSTSQNLWIFDQQAYDSNMWFHPAWAKVPETAIGINEEGMEKLLAGSNLRLIEQHVGNWKEVSGIFFQDILIFQKG